MGEFALDIYEKMITISCCACGLRFAIPASLEKNLRGTKQGFNCPMGHSLAFNGPNEADKLKAELAKERQRREMAERQAKYEAERATKAERAHDRTKKRVQKGVCTCCNRTFQNLARHMATKHPET